MYRGPAKGHNDGKGHATKKNGGKKQPKRRFSYSESPPMTALEYFIYICTILFVGVFTVMQGVFLYKLHRYEANFAETQSANSKSDARVLVEDANNKEAAVAALQLQPQNSPLLAMTNRQRIEFMANTTKRDFTPWPPLDAIVDSTENKVTGNPQFLLDFAVIGFEKAGTRSVKFVLNGHKEVDMKLNENVHLYLNKPVDFIVDMYDHHPNQDLVRGYNNNGDMYQPCSLQNIHTYFSETKLIIAARHPIRFFESLYNARIQNLPDPNKVIPTPQERIGFCKVHDNGCCTDHSHLALWLYKFGKTLDMPPAEIEDTIKNTHQYESEHTTYKTKNKIFFMEASQLVDQDWFRQQELLDDLQAFLGLKTPFKNGIPPAHPSPRSDTQDKRDKRKIDICQDQFRNLREELMIGARESSQWIRERFLKSEDVFVSQPDYINQALLSWMEDPCSPKTVKKDFDTKTIEGEIPFKAEDQPLVPIAPGSLRKFDTNVSWPALDEVVDSNNRLLADPQFLLDFAIIGIEKCGTSTLMKWLGAHPEAQCFQQEDTSMFMDKPGLLAKRLYKVYPGEKYKRGYKNPIDIFQPCVLRNFQELFPKTNLLLTIRHPVRYFESLHNFRIQNLPDPNAPFEPILQRIGICGLTSQGLCTDHAHFALWMYRLGKTVEMDTHNEIQKKIIQVHPYEANHYTYPSTNKIFLTEMTQFQDKDPERTEALKRDLASFLGLTHTFDQDVPHAIPGMKWSEESQKIRDSRKIDICEDQYKPLREELMKGARETSLWIRTFFLASKDVYVSSPEYFDQAMRAWMNDPCEDESQQDPRALSNWPPLGSLVNDDGEVVQDVQFLLDFAIIGVEKCGTSTLMVWLGSHPEIQCPQEENYSLMNNQVGKLVQDAYAMAPYEEYKRAYKNPLDLFYPNGSLLYLDQYFPKTKLLVTLRHPVRYFESLYNFRIQNHNQGNWDRSHIATPFERIGQCIGESFDGCTEHAHFGLWLYRMGKTLDMPETELDRSFFENHPLGTKKTKPIKMRNPVFLFEMSQFADKDPVRSQRLKSDLKEFLGVTKDFDSEAPHKVPGKKWSPEIQAVRDAHKMHICEEQYRPVRDVLMKGARETSTWIRESFIKSPDVHISSPEFFEEAMLAWMDDPCDKEDPSLLIRKNLANKGERGEGVREEVNNA